MPFIKTPHSSFTYCAHDWQCGTICCKFGINYSRKWPDLASVLYLSSLPQPRTVPLSCLEIHTLDVLKITGQSFCGMLLNLSLSVSSQLCPDDGSWAEISEEWCYTFSFLFAGAAQPWFVDTGGANFDQVTIGWLLHCQVILLLL